MEGYKTYDYYSTHLSLRHSHSIPIHVIHRDATIQCFCTHVSISFSCFMFNQHKCLRFNSIQSNFWYSINSIHSSIQPKPTNLHLVSIKTIQIKFTCKVHFKLLQHCSTFPCVIHIVNTVIFAGTEKSWSAGSSKLASYLPANNSAPFSLFRLFEWSTYLPVLAFF